MTFRPSGYVTVNGVNSNDLFFVVEATKIESLLLSFGDVKISSTDIKKHLRNY